MAIELGIEHSGWCPSGRLAEDGKIDTIYNLKETTGTDYTTRTMLNVRDSDGTLILNRGILEGGTALTVKIAKKLNKPYLIFNLVHPQNNQIVLDWITKNKISILNVAGPRESKRRGIYKQSKDVLTGLFSDQAGTSVQAR